MVVADICGCDGVQVGGREGVESATEDADRSSDSSDEDEDEGGPGNKRSIHNTSEGELRVSPEQRILEEVIDILDGAHADEA